MTMSDINKKIKEKIMNAISADSLKARGIPNPCVLLLFGEPEMPEELFMEEAK